MLAVEEKKNMKYVCSRWRGPWKTEYFSTAVIELHMNLKKLNWNTQTLSFLCFFTANTLIWASFLVWNERRVHCVSCRLCPLQEARQSGHSPPP